MPRWGSQARWLVPWQEPQRLDVDELMGLFQRGVDDERWLGQADSSEYLSLVTYLVQRSRADA